MKRVQDQDGRWVELDLLKLVFN